MKIDVANSERVSFINVNPRQERVQSYTASCKVKRTSLKLLEFRIGFCQIFYDEKRKGGSFWELKQDICIAITDFVDADFRDNRIENVYVRAGRKAWHKFIQEFESLDTEYLPPIMSDSDFRKLAIVLMYTSNSNSAGSGNISI